MEKNEQYKSLELALTNGHWYRLLAQPFETAPMQARDAAISKVLCDTSTIIAPNYEYPPDLFKGLKEGEMRELDLSTLKRLEDSHSINSLPSKGRPTIQMGADYLGLKHTYDIDTDNHGIEAAKAHAISLLQGDEALFADFEKKKAYDNAINTLIWSAAHEIEPPTWHPPKSATQKRIDDGKARETVIAGLEEAGVGRQAALAMLQTLKDHMAALAQQCGHGSGMTPQ